MRLPLPFPLSLSTLFPFPLYSAGSRLRLLKSLTLLLSSPRPHRLLRLLRAERVAVGVRENAGSRWRAVRVASDGGAEAGVAALAAAERADVVFACEIIVSNLIVGG